VRQCAGLALRGQVDFSYRGRLGDCEVSIALGFSMFEHTLEGCRQRHPFWALFLVFFLR
jgi:hypothetical protein